MALTIMEQYDKVARLGLMQGILAGAFQASSAGTDLSPPPYSTYTGTVDITTGGVENYRAVSTFSLAYNTGDTATVAVPAGQTISGKVQLPSRYSQGNTTVQGGNIGITGTNYVDVASQLFADEAHTVVIAYDPVIVKDYLYFTLTNGGASDALVRLTFNIPLSDNQPFTVDPSTGAIVGN